MRKLGIAAVLAAGMLGVGATGASAGPPEIPGPCAQMTDMFTTANIQMEPLPEPLGTVAGTAYTTVCGVTG